jgi:hypothetical protein
LSRVPWFTLDRVGAIAGVAVAWPLFLWLNQGLFASLSYMAWAGWVFLPAAMRILAVLLFEEAGAIGLVLGAYYTMHWGPVLDGPHQIMLSISSGLAPWLAVWVCRRLIDLGDDLRSLRPVHIVVLSVAGAAANSLLVTATLGLAGRLEGDLRPLMIVFLGDLNGTAIVLFVVSSAAAMVVRSLGRDRR